MSENIFKYSKIFWLFLLLFNVINGTPLDFTCGKEFSITSTLTKIVIESILF